MTIINQITSFKISGFTYNGTDTQLNYTAGVASGTAQPSKALVLDAGSNINSINTMTLTNLNTTTLSINGTVITSGMITNLTSLDGAIAGTGVANKVLILDSNRDINNIRNLNATTLTGTLQTASQPNITSIGTLSSLTLSGALSGVTTIGASGIVSITNTTTSTNTTTGALVVSGGIGIAGAVNIGNNLSVTGSLSMTGANRFITMHNSGLTNNQNVSFVLGRTAASNEQGEITFTYSTTVGSSILSLGHWGGIVLNVFSSGNVSIGNTSNQYKLDVNGSLNSTSLYLGGTQITATASELNYVDTTAGTAESSKAIILDSNRDIINIRNLTATNLTATNLTGTLQTSSQPNITSVGTLTSLNLSGNITGATTINASGVVSITNTTESTGQSAAALIISGGISVIKGIQVWGTMSARSTNLSTSPSTGSLTVDGGLGALGSGFFGHTVAPGQTARTGLTSWLTSGIQFRTGATSYTTSTTGTIASAVFSSFARPTLVAATAGTVTTEASTVYIDNSPLAGTNMTITNAYALWINAGRTILKDNSTSTNTTTGALVVTGGVGIGGAVNIGGALSVTGNITGTLATASQPNITTLDGVTSIGASNATTITGILQTAAQTNITSVGTLTGLTSSGVVSITNTTASSSTSTGALTVSGGVGITGALNIGNNLSVSGNINTPLSIASATKTIGGIYSVDGLIWNTIDDRLFGMRISDTDTLALCWAGGGLYSDRILFSNNLTPVGGGAGTQFNTKVYINNTTSSTNTTSGALVIIGGIGIGGATNIGGALSVTGNITGTLATANQSNITSVGTLTGLTSSGVVSITNTTVSTNTTTGALTVSGGVGIGGATNIGGTLSVTGNITGTLATNSQPNITSVGTLTGLTSSGAISITNTTASTDSITGALVVSGGVGIGGQVNTTNSITTTQSVGDGFVHNAIGTNAITLKSYINTANTWAQFGTSSNHELRFMTNSISRLNISNAGAISIPGVVTITSSGAFTVNGVTTLNNVVIGGNRTLAAWASTGPQFNTTANTFTDSSSAANSTYNSNIAINSFQQSTLAASNTNVTYGQLTTNVFIANGPTAGTNTTIRNRCSLVTGGPIVINPGSINISDWTSGSNIIHLRSGFTTSLVTDTGFSNIEGVVGVNAFNSVNFASNTAGRTMNRAATIHIINSPSTSGGNMTITNSHALYIANGNTLLADTTASSSTTTGALVVSGGVGINGAVNVGGGLNMIGNNDIITLNNSITSGRTTLKFVGDTVNWEFGSRNSTNTNYSNNFYIYGNAGYRLLIDPSGNIDIFNHDGSTVGLKLGGSLVTATANELNYCDITTIGTGQANKALVLDASRNITNIHQLSTTGVLSTTITNNTGTLFTYQSWTNDLATDINVALRISNISSAFGNTSSHSLRFMTTNTYRLSIDASGNVNIDSHNGSSLGLQLGGVLITASATELNYCDVVAGTGTASKALVLDASRDITNINSLTATSVLSTTLTGTLQTASQSNITSVGTLTGLTSSGIVSITNTTASTNTSSGALTIAGGVGIGGAVNIGGNVRFTSGTSSSVTNNGALVVSGGVGIGLNLNVGSGISAGLLAALSFYGNNTNGIQFRTGATSYTTSTTGTIASVVFSSFACPTFAANTAGTITTEASTVYIDNAPLAGTNMTITNAYALWINAGRTILKDNSTSTNTTTGALVVTGGVGIGGAVNVGTYVKTPYIQVGTSTDTSRLISCLDGITTVNSDRRITLGSSNSSGNQAEINFNYQGSNSNSNRLSLGFHSNTTLLNILNSGDVNIGGITSGCKLIVTRASNNNNFIRWTDGTTIADTFINSSGTPSIGSVSAHDFGFYTANGSSSQLYLKQGGNVGIGTNNPTSTLQVNGSLSKNSGTFDIQHPIKANTRLVHSFIEGPRCDLIYRGSIQLINGKAIVNLDTDCVASIQSAMSSGTFEALVQNPVCYLQNSTFDRIIGNINKNILTITCENINANSIVNWMVIGERKDQFIKEWNRTDSEGRLITEY